MGLIDLAIRLKLSLVSVFAWLYVRFVLGVRAPRTVRFRGFPSIYAATSANIVIGPGTMINSCSYRYHVNMHSGCKLIADTKDARIAIGQNCRIHGSCIHAVKSITIGSNVLIAANCQIIDSNAHNLSMDNPSNRINTVDDTPKSVVLEDDVWLGSNVLVLPGVSIGKGSVIGAGSVVTKDIPANVVAAGNPAKVIRSYD